MVRVNGWPMRSQLGQLTDGFKGKGSMLLSLPSRFPPAPLALVPFLPAPATDGRFPDGSHQRARTYTDPGD